MAINCSFYANTSAQGGAIYNQNASPIITNCIFWNNQQNGQNNIDGADNMTGTADDLLAIESNSSVIDMGLEIQLLKTTKDIPEDKLRLEVFPNPFSHQTQLQFYLVETSIITLQLFNQMGHTINCTHTNKSSWLASISIKCL